MTMPPETPGAPPPAAPSPWLVLRVWFALGLQSFGGGAATLALIRRAVVEQHRWVSEADFSRDWALCQITPGINLLALTILIGRRLAGAAGIAAALLGLLLPSAGLTLLLTAFYARARHAEAMQAALNAVIPATVGLGLLTAYQMARPPLQSLRAEGAGYGLFGVALLAGSGAAVLLWHLPVVFVLCAAGAVSAAVHGLRARRLAQRARAGSR